MKAYLQKFMATAVLGLALCSISSPAWAGAKDAPQVEIEVGYGASGSMAGARYSFDSQQYIGCYILGNSDFVTCSARDSTGKSFVCFGSQWKSMVKAITDFSHLSFSTVRFGTTSCDQVTVTNSSAFLK